MTRNEQTTKRTLASAATASIEIQLALGTGYCLDQRNFRRDALRILPAKTALGRGMPGRSYDLRHGRIPVSRHASGAFFRDRGDLDPDAAGPSPANRSGDRLDPDSAALNDEGRAHQGRAAADAD